MAGSFQLGASELTVGGNNLSTDVSGVIAGIGGSLVKVGTGTLTLSGTSSYTGATTVNAGTLRAGALNAFSPTSAFTVASGGTLDLNGFNQTVGSIAGAGSFLLGANELTVGGNNLSTDVSGVIAGIGGSLVKVGTGTLTLSGTSTYTGATTVNAGTLRAGALNTFSPTSAFTVASGGTLDLNGFNQTLASVANAGLVNMGTAPRRARF